MKRMHHNGRRPPARQYPDFSSTSSESSETSDSDSTTTTTSDDRRYDANRSPRGSTRSWKTKETLNSSGTTITRRRVRNLLWNWRPVGKPGVHLGGLEFRNAAAVIPPTEYDVTNPDGETLDHEKAEKLSDGIPSTRWCDTKCGALFITFKEPCIITGFRMKTAYCDPSKDPIMWVLHGTDDPDDPVWKVIHEQPTAGPLKLERMDDCDWIKVGQVVPVVQLRFQVMKVRGSVKEWREALKESAVVRSKIKAEGLRRERRKKTAKASIDESPDEDELKECSFFPQTNERHLEDVTMSDCLAHFTEWAQKGTDTLRTRRAAPAAPRTKPSTTSLAKSIELYHKATEYREKRAATAAKYEREQSSLNVSSNAQSSKGTFSTLYGKAQEIREKKRDALRTVQKEEAQLRGKSKVKCEEDPWVRLFQNKKNRKSELGLPAKSPPKGEAEEDIAECTFAPVTHAPPPPSVLKPRMLNPRPYERGSRTRSRTVPSTANRTPKRKRARHVSVSPPRVAWTPPVYQSFSSPPLTVSESSTADLMRQGFLFLNSRLDALEGRLGGNEELHSNDENRTVTDPEYIDPLLQS